MQPYTPHGDSNPFEFEVGVAGHPDATLYPARGQQLRRDRAYIEVFK